MARAAVLLAAVVAAVATGAVAANPRAEKVKLRPADVRLAKQVTLRQNDLGPGWEGNLVPAGSSDDELSCSNFSPDFSRYTITGRARSSFRFSAPPGATAVSAVEVFATRQQAAGDFVAGAKPALAPCLTEELRRELRGLPAGVHGRVLFSRMVRPPRLGERSAAYAAAMEVSGNGISLRAFLDVLAVQRGRTVTALIFGGIGSHVPSRASYAAMVAARMR